MNESVSGISVSARVDILGSKCHASVPWAFSAGNLLQETHNKADKIAARNNSLERKADKVFIAGRKFTDRTVAIRLQKYAKQTSETYRNIKSFHQETSVAVYYHKKDKNSRGNRIHCDRPAT